MYCGLPSRRSSLAKMPEDLRGALRRERGVDLGMKGAGLEIRIGRTALACRLAEQRDLHRLRHIDAGVLQQRGDVVGRRSHHRVLEVEQARAGDLLLGPAARSGSANESRAAPRSAPASERRPGAPLVHNAVIAGAHLATANREPKPRNNQLDEQFGLDQISVEVVDRQRVHHLRRHRDGAGQLLAVQRDQHVDGSGVALLDRRRRVARHHPGSRGPR